MATLWAKLTTPTGERDHQYELVSSPAGDDESASTAPSHRHTRKNTKRIVLLLITFLILMLTVGGAVTDHPAKAKALATLAQWSPGSTPTPAQPQVGDKGVVFDPMFYLKGVAGDRFRDVLRPDMKYTTTFHYAGLSNDLEQFCNLIYLAIISRRIPIIPPFEPSPNHIGNGGSTRNFGEIFDVPRLSASLGYPILEWADVKRARYNQLRETELPPLEGVEMEDIGCWSLWETLNSGHRPMESTMAQQFLYLNITWTPVPEFVRMTPGNPGDYHASTTALARLVLPETRKDVLKSPQLAYVSVVPDDQLTCFDVLYYTGVRETFEFERDIPVVWDIVGTNVHFAPKVEALADEYLRRLFKIEDEEDALIPPFIPVHIRRADFKSKCLGDKPLEECMAPLSAYERRVNQVHEELVQLFGADSLQATASQNVIVSSDEDNPAWWEAVKEKGWLSIDHEKEQTTEKHGAWYLTIIDSAIHSRGTGFVGTKSSTFSLLSGKRVHDWNGGPSRMVYFGKPGEDEKHDLRGRDLHENGWW